VNVRDLLGVIGCVEWDWVGIGSWNDEMKGGRGLRWRSGSVVRLGVGECGEEDSDGNGNGDGDENGDRDESRDGDAATEVEKDHSRDPSFGQSNPADGDERRAPSSELVSCESWCASPCPCRVSGGWG
jgi:hypothetical protein